MSMIVVDTSALVEHLRGARRVSNFIRRLAGSGPVLVPTIVMWELWKGATTPKRREVVAQFFETVTPDPFMPAMAQLAGDVHRAFRAAGNERPALDLIIASHALHHEAPLVTLDRDYDGIPGLDVVRVPRR